MLEVRGGFDFSEESLCTHHCSQLGLQDLERDVAVVLEVFSEVDRSHPTLTDLTLDAVAAFQRSVEAGDGVRAVHARKMRIGGSMR